MKIFHYLIVMIIVLCCENYSQEIKDQIIPDGYFIGKEEIRISNFLLDDIQISTVDYEPDGSISSKFKQPEIAIVLKNEKTENIKRYSTNDCQISADTLWFRINIPKVGEMRFNGNFIDKKGMFCDRKDIEELETVVMKGKIVLLKDNIELLNENYEFTYFIGD